ncbi:hypothetical protein [Sulfobacillus harzensis]|uniref:Uncharacterized protein n=1 Tax=Sulfobacillus harzensis TaxID=2729629 RepID=A0A7Y0L8F1_9FIRM|nr:hypothetical protein [Sulfobacillus harzensis]NMP23799.1 hypothetical protein [Sulfobacillus harzensis]
MTRWTKCRNKTCKTQVLAIPGVPRYCPACLKAHRLALLAQYRHVEPEARHV